MSNIPDRRPGIEPLFPARRVSTVTNPALRYLLFALLGSISIPALVVALALSAVLLGFVPSRAWNSCRSPAGYDSQRGWSDDGEGIAGGGTASHRCSSLEMIGTPRDER